MNSLNPALGWMAIVVVYVGLVVLAYWIAKRISPGFLGKQDPEFLFLTAVLMAAIFYAVLSD